MNEWREISPEEFRLVVDKKYVAYLTRMPFPPRNWLLTFKNRGVEIPNNTIDILKWKATVEVSNLCNREIANYSAIRDHLPNFRSLAEKAGILDEMD